MATIAFNSSIGPVPLDVIISEKHEHSLGITSDPIETGAEVNDHAYLKPKRLTLTIGAQHAAETFAALVQLQASRQPFTMVSGLFLYSNMLIENLQAQRDETYARVLSGTVDLKEIIIVDTAYSTVDEPNGSEAGEAGEAGGKKSTRAARPSPNKTKPGDTATADRAAGTVQRGDMPTKTIDSGPTQTILKRVFG